MLETFSRIISKRTLMLFNMCCESTLKNYNTEQNILRQVNKRSLHDIRINEVFTRLKT